MATESGTARKVATNATIVSLINWAARYAPLLFLLPLIVYAIFNYFDPLARNNFIDLDLYQRSGQAVIDDRSPYDSTGLPFTYPPFAALVFVPFALTGEVAMRIVWFATNLAMLTYIISAVLRLSGVSDSRLWRASIGLSGLMLWLQPVTWGMVVGQINIALATLVLWGSRDDAAGNKWYRGVAIGVATGMKLMPGLFIVYLLLIRRIRTAFIAGAGFLATVAIGFLVLPSESRWYWPHVMDVNRYSPNNNDRDIQTLAGTLARHMGRDWPPMALSLTLACVLAIGGLGVAVMAHRRGHSLLGLTLCGIIAPAVSPFAWSHHWVWLVPLTLLVIGWAAQRSRTALLVAVTSSSFLLLAWPLGYLTHDRLGPILGLLALPIVEPLDVIYGNLYLWILVGALVGTFLFLRNEERSAIGSDTG